MVDLAFRQVHLDFHTSPLLPDVGADFDPDTFAATLKAAHVNSVTVFARCHHGMCYYPSRIGPVHPGLKRDLLGEMIEACHRSGIRTPVYITVVWDEYTAHEHPEWLQVSPTGVAGVTPPFTSTFTNWKWLCMNSPYMDYVAALAEEVVSNYEADGLFFDIIMQVEPGCLCKYCLDGMVAEGLDPTNPDQQRRYANAVARRAMARLTEAVHARRPGLPIFYNSRLRLARDRESGMRAELGYESHVEIESLPSGGWGYLHYPMYSRYFQTLGGDFLGMTARFHKSWADFGGLKNQAALEYEVFSMLATGGKCSIGDQMHPRGRLEQAAYERIGAVYASVEAKEPWCIGAKPVKEVGVLITVEGWERHADLTPEEGATRALLECQRQFQLVDEEAEFDDYEVLILPDRMPVGEELAAKLRTYVANGGGLLISGSSGLTDGGFVLGDLVGAEYAGRPAYSSHYFQACPELGLPEMDHVMYEEASLVSPLPGTEVLARIVEPYFERTWRHFSSHRQTPPANVSPWPEVTQRGKVIYIASPVFSAYRKHGNLIYRKLIEACLARLAPEQVVQAALPSGGQVTLLRQEERLIAHLLYYPIERRTPDLDIIEDVIAMPDVRLQVRTGRQPSQVYLVPQRQRLNQSFARGVATVIVPEVRGHQMVAFEF